MSSLEIIKGVRCYEENGTVFLKLEDVARGLGFTEIAASGNECVKWSRVRKYLSDLKVIDTRVDGVYPPLPHFIPENVFYRLAMKAKNETAEKFQALVADEIIPSIRRTGGYVANDDLFIHTYLPFADENTKTLFRTTLHTISEQNKLIQQQRNKIDQDKPLVEFASNVIKSDGSVSISNFAKMLCSKGMKIGNRRLLWWLRGNKYLMKDFMPYQRWVNQGVFEVVDINYEYQVVPRTYITPKGQKFLYEVLSENYGK